MSSVRRIEAGETAEFLALLCRVFGLDPVRAQEVFYTEPFFDLDRKWAVFEGGRIVSILTTTPLLFGWGRAIGIAGVGTDADERGRGHGLRLIEAVLEAAEQEGEGPALLFAHQTGLYERAGFEAVDEVVRAPIASSEQEPEETLPFDEVRRLYDAWAAGSPARLRRDDARWDYWRWTYRSCEPFGGGYVCHEPAVCREAVVDGAHPAWPVGTPCDWFGLRSMIAELAVPVGTIHPELLLLARNVPTPPRLFMTDQF